MDVPAIAFEGADSDLPLRVMTLQLQLALDSVAEALSAAVLAAGSEVLQLVVDAHFDVDPVGFAENSCGVTPDVQWHNEGESNVRRGTFALLVYVTRGAARPVLEHLTAKGPASPPSPLLLLMCPGSNTWWGARRRCIARTLGVLSPSSAPCLMTELLLTTLALSKHPKCAEVWQHRQWLIPRLLAATALPDGHGASRKALLLALERDCLATASDRHRMNYSAWQYRRWMLRQSSLVPCTLGGLEAEVQSATAFLELHVGDASAAAYLTDVMLFAVEALPSAAPTLWALLWRKSWALLRRHAERGHESLWTLRLSLVDAALKSRKREGGLEIGKGCGWTVGDELEFVACHVDACSVADAQMGSSRLEDCSGSSLWNAWHAARYGIRLCCLLCPSAAQGAIRDF
jgi:hypothetical protein